MHYPIRKLWSLDRVSLAKRVVPGFNSECAIRASKNPLISGCGEVEITGPYHLGDFARWAAPWPSVELRPTEAIGAN